MAEQADSFGSKARLVDHGTWWEGVGSRAMEIVSRRRVISLVTGMMNSGFIQSTGPNLGTGLNILSADCNQGQLKTNSPLDPRALRS